MKQEMKQLHRTMIPVLISLDFSLTVEYEINSRIVGNAKL